MSAVYNIFFRNWENNRASVEQIDLAVSKGLITAEEADMILATPQKD